ncbi:MAG TPA: sugar transferase [Fulvivirga sp.]|nr:sugar transferase [Fulvivirga sp.]
MYKELIKRPLDIIVSTLLLVVLSPLLFLIAIVIYVESGKPIIFRQTRIGKDKKSFRIYKFRTMVVDSKPFVRADGTYISRTDDKRVTRIGRYLRIGFDELPQLINIIKGEMSLVGPRPDLPIALDMLTETQHVKYNVRPGLTNLPAISGRNSLTFQERVNLDIIYINSISFLKDLTILFKTLLVISGIKTNFNERQN